MTDLGCHYVEPVHNPEAVLDYYFLDHGYVEKEIMKGMIMKAKQHLSAVGWTFRYIFDEYGSRKKVKYVPPNGSRKHITLRSACKYYLKSENGGVEEIKSAGKCRTKRKARFDDEKNAGKIKSKDFDRKDEERSLCLDNRQFSFEDLEVEDGVKEIQRKMRALHLENAQFKFDDSEFDVLGKNVDVGKTKLNYSGGNDSVSEVYEISEEEAQEINFRNFKKKKVSYDKEVGVGKTKFNAREKRKRRITACDLFGERMLRCMQGT